LHSETGGPFLTSPLAPGDNFIPRGELGPQGWNLSLGGMFTPSFNPGDEHSLLIRRMEGKQRISPPGDNFTPWGKSLPLGSKLRMGIRGFTLLICNT
jgi:hypothetical protein